MKALVYSGRVGHELAGKMWTERYQFGNIFTKRENIRVELFPKTLKRKKTRKLNSSCLAVKSKIFCKI